MSETVPGFPSMIGLQTVFRSILADGFEGHREPLEVKFADNASMQIEPFSIQMVDGASRALSCLALAHYLIRMEPT